MAGAVIGTGVGSIPRMAKMAAGAAAPANFFGAGSSMVAMANSFDSKANRVAMFGGGALLGGFAFGGNKSHARGFNSNRGSRITRG
jgi:hypothetical protein